MQTGPNIFVVVSRDYFEKTRPNLKTYLLTEGFAEDGEDAFDRAMQEIRREGSPFMVDGHDDPNGGPTGATSE